MQGAGHSSVPGGAGQGRRGPRPQTGSPVGSQACAPPGPPIVWLGRKLPHPAPRRQTWTSGFHSLKSGLNHPRRECEHLDLSPPELEPPSPKESGASCPCVAGKNNLHAVEMAEHDPSLSFCVQRSTPNSEPRGMRKARFYRLGGRLLLSGRECGVEYGAKREAGLTGAEFGR